MSESVHAGKALTMLIGESELRLADAAREAGVSSAAKFSASFKTVHGVTPSAFRSARFPTRRSPAARTVE